MSRPKSTAETETGLTKEFLSSRLAELRADLFGHRGRPEMARSLGIPVRSWYNYEEGVSVPGEVILKLIELTSVEPTWLLHGTGPKYRRNRDGTGIEPTATVSQLIRAALELTEGGEEASSGDRRARPRRSGAKRPV